MAKPLPFWNKHKERVAYRKSARNWQLRQMCARSIVSWVRAKRLHRTFAARSSY